jgi:hypothetical protein
MEKSSESIKDVLTFNIHINLKDFFEDTHKTVDRVLNSMGLFQIYNCMYIIHDISICKESLVLKSKFPLIFYPLFKCLQKVITNSYSSLHILSRNCLLEILYYYTKCLLNFLKDDKDLIYICENNIEEFINGICEVFYILLKSLVLRSNEDSNSETEWLDQVL